MTAIIKDYFSGLVESLNISLVYHELLGHDQLRKITTKMISTNFWLHIVMPTICYGIMSFDIAIFNMISMFALFVVSVFSACYNFLQIFEFICNISLTKSSKTPIADLLCSSLVFSLIIGVIFVFKTVSQMIFHVTIGSFFAFFLLALYHSLYAYNSLWKSKGYTLGQMITIVECTWPYYIGYGTPISLLFLFSSSHYVTFAYNTYLLAILVIPIARNMTYHNSREQYPRIYLGIFISLVALLVKLINRITSRK